MARKRKKPETEIDIDMTPMIDIVFQLLIFFIVTLKFKTLEKKLNSYLPTDFGTSIKPQDVEEQFITIKLKPNPASTERLIRKPLQYYVETTEITGSMSDILKQIETKLTEFRRIQKDAKGKIEPWRGAPHAKVVQVLDLFHATGYQTITFVGLTANENINDALYEALKQQLRN